MSAFELYAESRAVAMGAHRCFWKILGRRKDTSGQDFGFVSMRGSDKWGWMFWCNKRTEWRDGREA